MSTPPIVVAGLGSAGLRHVANLRHLEAGPLVLYRSGHGAPLAPALRDLPVRHDLDAALALRPRAVVVANPTALHLPVALAAARAGAHVFVEKPLSHSLEGVPELRRALEATGATCLLGFHFRFHPALRHLKEWLDEGLLGRVVSAHVHWGEYLPGWHPGEDYRRSYAARRDLGGGVVLTLCHPFDTLRWLLGEIVAVSAETGRLCGLELDVEDVAQVTLRFAGGAIGSVYLDYLQRPRVHVLRLVGTRGVARWDADEGVAYLDVTGQEHRRVLPLEGFERNAMFRAEMAHFLACVAGETRPACSLHDGVRALEVALAAGRAAEAGRRIDV